MKKVLHPKLSPLSISKVTGARLKECRLYLKKTQQELADQLEVSRQMISQYEAGETNMPVQHIVNLYNLSRINPLYILGVSEQPVVLSKELSDVISSISSLSVDRLLIAKNLIENTFKGVE